jgi:hypothetical protein
MRRLEGMLAAQEASSSHPRDRNAGALASFPSPVLTAAAPGTSANSLRGSQGLQTQCYVHRMGWLKAFEGVCRT